MKVICVVGARPNFMKIAPVHRALEASSHESVIVHTGQHYTAQMSDVFIDELDLPQPHHQLRVGSGSHAVQTAKIMEAFEPVLLAHRPDGIVVAGDVNSTLACALVAVKEGTRIAHLEAGLRSGDRTMPEEINRILTDAVSDLLLIPSRDAEANLLHEGVDSNRIHFVGNAMIDSLLRCLPRARALRVCNRHGVEPGAYVLITLHRPSNVDPPDQLHEIAYALAMISSEIPVLFPVHPRTRERLESFGLTTRLGGVKLLEPLGYFEFLSLESDAALVITDSGGIQEETTVLGVRCLTFRETTERPITVSLGTNTLIGADPRVLHGFVKQALAEPRRELRIPEHWDGHAGERSAEAIISRWAS